MDPALQELLEISHAVGRDEDQVQAGGGNTSVKTDRGTMYIKASGTTLGGMSEDSGWVELDLEAVLAVVLDDSLNELEAHAREAALVERLGRTRVSGPGDRPSVETVVHALLGRVVIHTHPIAVNALGCTEEGEAYLRDCLDGTPDRFLWIPYCDPGYPLSRLIRQRFAELGATTPESMPFALVQQNHGLFVHAESPREAIARHAECLQRAGAMVAASPPYLAEADRDAARPFLMALRRAHAALTSGQELPVECHTAPLMRVSRRPDLDMVAAVPAICDAYGEGALTPDQIVYCGPKPLRVASTADADEVLAAARRYLKTHGLFPKVMVVEGVATVLIGTSIKNLDANEVVAASIARQMAGALGAGLPIRYLPQRDVDYIMNWEVEHYRAKLMGGLAGRPLEGRVALVTGAGSGLGRAQAWGLARAGAIVAFTDIDLEGALVAIAELGTEYNGRAIALRMDVTDEKSVANAFDALLTEFGGIDIMVNCAGIAPPHELVDFPVESFRRALEINLTGYFLPTREAARIMKQQSMGGSIVCLSSKSGLEASKANTAYNATKAGEIHMARGWALELAADLIRVNSIAPGNVFEGSKIWNDDYIAKAAAKKGIRPEEVIPHYVALSPLNKEIKGQDIADATVYLCSDASRRMTGQVLVIDGGQVMVR